MKLKNTLHTLTEFFDSNPEWLLINSAGKSFALKKQEIELEIKYEKILLSFLDDTGFQTWRVLDFKYEKSEIVFDLTRNFQKTREKIRFVPRISVAALGEDIELARLEKANQTAASLASQFSDIKLRRVALNKENGRFARIIIEKQKQKIAVLADVSDSLDAEILLSNAIIWLTKMRKRSKEPIKQIWILAEKKHAPKLEALHACLKEGWKQRINVYEISRKKQKAGKIKPRRKLEMDDLWRKKATKLKPLGKNKTSSAASEIILSAPKKIDRIFSKSGETLRFLGLPFARIRETFGKEKVWFGTEREKQILVKDNGNELENLLRDLKIYRASCSPNKQHFFYQTAPEAWLEAILRQNIRLLDANLILSPVYNQFRTSRDKIDILALRRDGRLIIIELKVAPDREMIFQAIDYWRKLELQRRTGKLAEANLFGKRKIANKPAIIYLVAPTMSFHLNFKFLAGTISENVKIYRFDLAENWREELRVLRREKINQYSER